MELVFVLLFKAIQYYSYALIIYILMSWFPGARESSIGQILGKVCEPYLEVFRRFIPPLGMFDFSPIVGILALQFAQYGLAEVFNWIR
ncbi:MAG: YggT family protein [Bacillus sp. (in: firmicutes)]